MRNRISVTALDQYQRFLDDDEMSEQEFIAQITTKIPPTTAMAVGTAWHSVLENWQGETADNRYRVWRSEIEHWDVIMGNNHCLKQFLCFDLSALATDDPIIIGEPHEREQKRCWYGADGVQLVGKFDVITPFAVIDHKLTASFDPERYFNSWQWRCYLAMTGKPKMIYQVFEHAGLQNLAPTPPNLDYEEWAYRELCDNKNSVKITNYHRLEVLAYDGMIDEVKDIVADFNNLLLKYGVINNGKCQ